MELDLRTLGAELEKQGVRMDSYSLSGGLPNESYCIDKIGDEWICYYSERGRKTGLVKFKTESEACNYMLRKLVRFAKE